MKEDRWDQDAARILKETVYLRLGFHPLLGVGCDTRFFGVILGRRLRGYPGSYAAFDCGYLNGATGFSSSGASRRNIPRIELIRTHASLDCGVRS